MNYWYFYKCFYSVCVLDPFLLLSQTGVFAVVDAAASWRLRCGI